MGVYLGLFQDSFFFLFFRNFRKYTYYILVLVIHIWLQCFYIIATPLLPSLAFPIRPLPYVFFPITPPLKVTHWAQSVLFVPRWIEGASARAWAASHGPHCWRQLAFSSSHQQPLKPCRVSPALSLPASCYWLCLFGCKVTSSYVDHSNLILLFKIVIGINSLYIIQDFIVM